MREIPLTQNQVAKVDDEDHQWLSAWSWCVSRSSHLWYAMRGTRRKDKQISFRMHNVIWNWHFGEVPEGFTVDHIDLDGLNNQKLNLRLATATQQAQNRRIQKNNTSGYKGVSWRQRDQKWRAYITVDDKQISLGVFDDLERAVQTYDQSAIEYFGDFARTNEGAVSNGSN